PIEFLTPGIPVGGEILDAAGEKSMHARKYQHQQELPMQPSGGKPLAGPRQVEPGEPGHDHGRIDDRPEHPTLHHLEGFGLLRAWLSLAMVDEQTRQIEHAGHPRDDRDHMERLDPYIHRETTTIEPTAQHSAGNIWHLPSIA